MDGIVLSVGTELITGQCVDTNSAWLSAELTRLGVRVIEHLTVGDDLAHVAQAIRLSLERSELVVITGGLGPTRDDLTREAIALAIDQPLEQNAEALAQIEGFFARWQRPMPDSNRNQALLPRTCTVLENRRGTAPGVGWLRDGRRLFAFPGVPSEMKEMFREHLVPAVASTGGPTTVTARLQCFGIGEAKLGEAIEDLMERDRNPLVGTTASEAVLSVRIVGWADDERAAAALVEADCDEVRRRLGKLVFGAGDTTLQHVVGGMLAARRATVATAESCTGGLLASYFTDVPGSSAYFLRGYVTYSNAAKSDLLGIPGGVISEKGAVSAEVAIAMAERCRKRAAVDHALSITGIAGPDGGSPPDKPVGLVYIGMADASGTRAERFLFGEHLTRREIRDRACKTALNLLRLELLRGA